MYMYGYIEKAGGREISHIFIYCIYTQKAGLGQAYLFHYT